MQGVYGAHFEAIIGLEQMRRARTINEIEKDHGVHPVQVGPRASTIDTAFWNPYIPEKTLLHSDFNKPLGPAQVNVPADYLAANRLIPVDSTYGPLIAIVKCVIYELPN